MTIYKVFQVTIFNAKNGKTEFDQYACSVKNEKDALDAVNNYATKRVARYYKAGSTFTIIEI